MNPTARLAAIADGTDAATALALFDALPAVTLEEMRGSWRGKGVPTGHPLDGMLERLGWRGKRFGDPEDAHPLVFERRSGEVFEVDPAFVPMGLLLRHARWFRHTAVAFRLGSRLVRTRSPRARLRMTEFRGVVTATMIYDALPVQDGFRQVDADTRLGVMDLRGMTQPFVFVLRRD